MDTSVHEHETIMATDAGGTMTDAFIVDSSGSYAIGKALTSKEDQSISYREGYKDASTYWGRPIEDAHKSAVANIYTGTLYLNTILERKGWTIGLIVTKGQESMYIHERGHSWLGLGWEEILHHKLHRHVGAEMFKLDSRLVKGVSERIASGSYFMVAEPGRVKVPLNEREVEQAVNELLDENVQAIAVTYLYSYLNPAHELRTREIAQRIMRERGVDIPIILSSEIVPVMKEVQRMKSTLFEASAGEIVRQTLMRVEKAAQDMGYRHQLSTLASYGSVVNIRHPRMYETILSGPTGGLIGAKAIGDLIGVRNIVTADIGGTSFDVGLIENGEIALKREPDFAQNRLALPMVSIDSIGAGAGSVIRVDPKFKHVSLGPDSAGSDVGVCYNYPEVTVSDCNVVLGYLDPNYFLGGTVKLDKARAEEALSERVARPWGLGLYEAAWGVLEILHSNLNQHLVSMLRARGANPSDWHMFMFGGAGPLHLYGIKVPFKKILTFPFAAAFSAFGVAAADYSKRFHHGASIIIPPGADTAIHQQIAEQISEMYADLESKAAAELAAEGKARRTRVTFGASMRYLGVLEVLDVTFTFGRVDDAADLVRAIQEFEDKYRLIYGDGARYPESGFFISELFVEAFVDKPKPKFTRSDTLVEAPSASALKGHREAYFDGRWYPFAIYEMDEMRPGNRLEGPAIIEHPMTTLVIPPGYSVRFDEWNFIEFYQPGSESR